MAAPEGKRQNWSAEKYDQLLRAAAAKKMLLLRSFRKEEGLRPSKEQLAQAKKALEKIGEAEGLLNMQIRLYLAEKKDFPVDIERVVHRLSIGLYILSTLRDVHAKAKEKGDYASYNLFLSSASEVSRLLRTDYMQSDYERMVSEFTQVQSKLDACAEVFGTKSYDITGAVENFKFRLARMQQDMQKEIAQKEAALKKREIDALPEWNG